MREGSGMNILVTNDDGFACPGVWALAAALRGGGHNVFAVTPDGDRSGTSHAISLRECLEIRKLEEGFWVCRGTPVDCVTLALAGGTPFRADAVVSGINAGANMGTDIIYSGTAAAARQAALGGLPGIAFSLVAEEGFFWEEAARWAAANLETLSGLWYDEVFVNVNMPNLAVLRPDFELTYPVRRRYTQKVREEGGAEEGGWKRLRYSEFTVRTEDSAGSDYDAVGRGAVSVSRVLLAPVAGDVENGGR